MYRNKTKKTSDFIDRVSIELDKMEISIDKKKIILDLLEIEFTNPTNEKDVIPRYRNIILTNKKM